MKKQRSLQFGIRTALPAVTTAIFPQPLLPPAAATLVRLPSATRFLACCCAAAGPAVALAPPAFSAMAGRFAVAVVADEEKRREEATLLDIVRTAGERARGYHHKNRPRGSPLLLV